MKEKFVAFAIYSVYTTGIVVWGFSLIDGIYMLVTKDVQIIVPILFELMVSLFAGLIIGITKIEEYDLH